MVEVTLRGAYGRSVVLDLEHLLLDLARLPGEFGEAVRRTMLEVGKGPT